MKKQNKIIENARSVSCLVRDLEYVERMIEGIRSHSFGFGTSQVDVDEFLRPIALEFLKKKKENLEIKIESMINPYYRPGQR
jgi:hypothetical protein